MNAALVFIKIVIGLDFDPDPDEALPRLDVPPDMNEQPCQGNQRER